MGQAGGGGSLEYNFDKLHLTAKGFLKKSKKCLTLAVNIPNFFYTFITVTISVSGYPSSWDTSKSKINYQPSKETTSNTMPSNDFIPFITSCILITALTNENGRRCTATVRLLWSDQIITADKHTVTVYLGKVTESRTKTGYKDGRHDCSPNVKHLVAGCSIGYKSNYSMLVDGTCVKLNVCTSNQFSYWCLFRCLFFSTKFCFN